MAWLDYVGFEHGGYLLLNFHLQEIRIVIGMNANWGCVWEKMNMMLDVAQWG